MIKWKEFILRKENRDLKNKIKSCLELIEDLSMLEYPLFNSKTPLSFKKKYIKVVNRAKKVLES